jgi:hypothetical protein
MPDEDSSQPEPEAQQVKRWHVRPMDSSDRLAKAIEEQNRTARFAPRPAQRETWNPWWKLDGEPTRLLERWSELASSDELRTRVRGGLLIAYANACSSELNASGCMERLEVLQTGASDVIAGELLALGLLTDRLLTDRLPEMVADVTVSAGMINPSWKFRADLSRCPEGGIVMGGQYWLRHGEIEGIRLVLNPRLCYWRAQLLRAGGGTLAKESPAAGTNVDVIRPRRGRKRSTPNLHPEVEPYLDRVSVFTTRRITIEDFCRVSGFGDDTVFGAWRRGNGDRCKAGHARIFESTLKLEPAEFLKRLAAAR